MIKDKLQQIVCVPKTIEGVDDTTSPSIDFIIVSVNKFNKKKIILIAIDVTIQKSSSRTKFV